MTLSHLMILIYNKENQWCSNLEQYYTESSFLRMLVWVDNPNSWFRQQRGRMEFSGISSPINGGDSKGSPRTGKGIYIEQEPANNKQWMGFPDPCFQVKREFAHATHHISWLHVIRFRITDARRRRRLVLSPECAHASPWPRTSSQLTGMNFHSTTPTSCYSRLRCFSVVANSHATPPLVHLAVRFL